MNLNFFFYKNHQKISQHPPGTIFEQSNKQANVDYGAWNACVIMVCCQAFEEASMKYNEAECKLRNMSGSENGTCKCKGRNDCPNPPKITPVGRRMKKLIKQIKL